LKISDELWNVRRDIFNMATESQMSEAERFDAVMRKILTVSKDELKKRQKAWKQKQAKKKRV